MWRRYDRDSSGNRNNAVRNVSVDGARLGGDANVAALRPALFRVERSRGSIPTTMRSVY
jgi:hypothetical protein